MHIRITFSSGYYKYVYTSDLNKYYYFTNITYLDGTFKKAFKNL